MCTRCKSLRSFFSSSMFSLFFAAGKCYRIHVVVRTDYIRSSADSMTLHCGPIETFAHSIGTIIVTCTQVEIILISCTELEPLASLAFYVLQCPMPIAVHYIAKAI